LPCHSLSVLHQEWRENCSKKGTGLAKNLFGGMDITLINRYRSYVETTKKKKMTTTTKGDETEETVQS
jgi:hypothetical protein